MRSKYLTKFTQLAIDSALFIINGIILVALACYLYVEPQLPAVEALKDIKLQTPMTVYTADGELFSFYGEKRRIPISYEQIPEKLNQALIATEDKRFFDHSGVDPVGIARAVFNLLSKGQIDGGGSTITMQLARNFFLSFDQTFTRKTKEIFLSWKIERALSKKEILTLYWNKIDFSMRAHGVGAAAEVYYGTTIDQLTLPQLAILAGIPKGPTTHNPLANPEKALNRRNHVLRRMYLENYIDEATYNEAINTPLTATYHGQQVTVRAPYLAEMVRREMIERFGIENAYTSGYRVYTSLQADLQRAARESLRSGLLAYDMRHGYRGPENYFENIAQQLLTINSAQLSQQESAESVALEQQRQTLINQLDASLIAPIDEVLNDIAVYGDLMPAIVLSVGEQHVQVLLKKYDRRTPIAERVISLDWPAIAWARPFINESRRGPAPRVASDVLKVGDQIRVYYQDSSTNPWRLAQVPEVSAGLVSLNPNNGGIVSLVGGFDYDLSKYNFVTQGQRQIGSNIKPFIYSAALEKGYTAATVVNDAPLTQVDESNENIWRPENSSGVYKGPTRLRNALKSSTNLVSIRLLKDIGTQHAVDFMAQLGFDQKRLPRVDSLALGAAEFTPLEVATAYAIFANGGYKVAPYFIERIEDPNGNILFEAEPVTVCTSCETIIAKRKALEQTTEQVSSFSLTSELPSTETDTETTQSFDPEAELLAELEQENAQVLDFNAPIKLMPELPVAEHLIAPRVIPADNVFILNSMMQDVITRGTAYPVLYETNSPLLSRSDLAGKTGTTNEAKDAWFSGYNADFVTTAWVGYADYLRGLGRNEYGGKAALPIWQGFMEQALATKPNRQPQMPVGIVTARIDPVSGLLAPSGMPGAIFEIFRAEHLPKTYAELPAVDPFNQESKKSSESIF